MVAPTADIVYRTVDSAAYVVAALARHLRVLLALHSHILHDHMPSPRDGHTHAGACKSEVLVVAHGQVLQVVTARTVQVQYGVGDAVAVAVQHDAVAALADNAHIIGFQ